MAFLEGIFLAGLAGALEILVWEVWVGSLDRLGAERREIAPEPARLDEGIKKDANVDGSNRRRGKGGILPNIS